MINNKGLAPIFIIILIILISASAYLGYNFYTTGQLPFSNLQSNLTTKYNSFGFIKFKLPPINQEKVAEFLKKPENAKCYKKEYFTQPELTSYDINLYNFPTNEEPLCSLDDHSYGYISVSHIDVEFSKSVFNSSEIFKWSLDSNLSNENFEIYISTTNTEEFGKYNFLINKKKSHKDEAIVLGIMGKNASQDSLEYQYALDLLKVIELKEFTEFSGLSNCKPNECKELEVSKYFETQGYFRNSSYVIRNSKITLTDTSTGNEYYKFVNPNQNIETDSEINELSKINNFLIFDYFINPINLENDVKNTYKIGLLDLVSGEIKDIVVNPLGVRFQDFLVFGEDVYYITGNSCADECLNEDVNKYLYKFNLSTMKSDLVLNKSLEELGVTTQEKNKSFNILNFENNKLLIKVGLLLQPAYDYVLLDVTSGEVTPLTKNFEVTNLDEETKEAELGVANLNKLIIRGGIVTQE